MPNVEEGAVYPRVVESPFGLPGGWKAIERAYGNTSKSAGLTYIRFDGPDGRHKAVGNIQGAIKHEAKDRGLDPEEALQKHKAALVELAAQRAREAEERGILKGEKRVQAIGAFREVHGPLNGATIRCLPGWRVESKLLEGSGQISARYYDPEGNMYELVKDIECLFGMKMQRGDKIPDIEEARANFEVDSLRTNFENEGPMKKARKLTA